MSRLLRIARLPLPALLLLLEAALWLLVARVALRLIAFPRLAAHLGSLRPPSVDDTVSTERDTLMARRVAHAVRASAINAPLDLVCLPRALAAWQMLRLRNVPSRLHFGKLVREGKSAGQELHAWLTSSGVEVTGYPVAYDCVELGYFARLPKD